MSKLFIPIIPETLEMLTELNNGVTPQIEEHPTLYVYNGSGTAPEIVKQPKKSSEFADALWNIFVEY